METHMKMKLTLLVIVMLGFGAIAAAVLLSSVDLGSTGTIKGVNVNIYSDVAGTQSLAEISWGVLEPSDSVNRTIYVKNTGNVPMTITMTHDAPAYLSLVWTRENVIVSAGTIQMATLTLTASSNAPGENFEFKITITGTG